MANLNKVQLIGNLTREVEIKYTGKGTAIADISIAVNRKWKDDSGPKEETTFVDLTAFGKTAELAQQYLSKGSSCYFEGRLNLETWEDKATQQKRSRMKVIIENMQFLGGKKDSGNSPQSAAKSGNQRQAPASNDADDDSDIPF
jgi:single-strand DNA-binding protein